MGTHMPTMTKVIGKTCSVTIVIAPEGAIQTKRAPFSFICENCKTLKNCPTYRQGNFSIKSSNFWTGTTRQGCWQLVCCKTVGKNQETWYLLLVVNYASNFTSIQHLFYSFFKVGWNDDCFRHVFHIQWNNRENAVTQKKNTFLIIHIRRIYYVAVQCAALDSMKGSLLCQKNLNHFTDETKNSRILK